MTTMQSLAWMNGQYQQKGPLSQSPKAASEFSYSTMRNQQHGTANTSNQYMTAQTGARPPQNAKFTHYYGACSQRQPPDCQTKAVHQAVSFQQTAGGNNYLQPSPTNLQSGNPSLQVTHGLQQHFHQNTAQNVSTQSPPNVTLANSAYPQQEISANWNQSVGVRGIESIRTQNGNIVSDCMFHNSNGESNKSVSPYTTMATLPQHREVAYNGTMEPAVVHHTPTAHDNNYRQNGTQHGFNPPCSNEGISQSFRNDSKTTNSSSSGYNVHVSSPSQIPQQYLTHNNGGEATSSINSNSYNRQYETNLSLSKPNDCLSNPAADAHAQQELLKQHQSIARIEDYLRMPSTTGSDGRPEVYTSSPYGQKQDVSMVTMRESNQNMQPVTSAVTEIYNSNVYQATPQSLRHSSPKAAHSVMSIQHSIHVQPPQSSLPNIFSVSAKGDVIRNVSRAEFIPENNVGSLSYASQLMQLLQVNNKKQSSVENHCERLEMLPVKANDSSIHSSPGRTRAVAVVQPLLHESYQVAGKQNSSNTISQLSEGTDESLSNPEKLVISPKAKQVGHLKVGPYLHPENPNQMRSNTHAIRHSAASNDGTIMSPSSSSRPQDLSPKQLRTVDSVSKLDIDTQVHQRVSSTAQQSVTFQVPVSPIGDKEKSEMPIDAKRVELSSVPTTPWTIITLTKYIQDSEKAQIELKEFTMSTMHKLVSMFWDGNFIHLKCALKTGIYNTVMTDVKQFFREHLQLESVILSQVKSCFETQLKSYHVLKEKEVYSELPYKSSWLNVNEQLDDIDKEFDFPPSLKSHLNGLMSDGQLDTDNVETDDSTPAQTVKEVSKLDTDNVETDNSIPAQTVKEVSKLDTDNVETDNSTPAQTVKEVSKLDTDNVETDNSIPAQTVKEVSKLDKDNVETDNSIPAQTVKEVSKLDTDNVETDNSIPAQTVKEVSNKMSSKELDPVDPSQEKQDSFVETTLTQTASPSKMESADSSDSYLYSFKIQVLPPEDAKVIFEEAQSNLPEIIDMDYQPERVLNISVEGEIPKVIDATLRNSKLENKTFRPIEEACCIERWKETIWGSNTTYLSKCQCKIKQSNKDITEKTCVKEVIAVQEKDAFRSDGKLHSATERENNNPVMAFLWPEIINVFSHTIDFPEDDKLHSDSDKDPMNISHISIDSSQSSIILLSDEEEHLSSSESEMPSQMPYFEYDSNQAQVKLTESGQSNGSDEKETNTISRNCTEIQSDPEVECVPDQWKFTGDMHSCTSVRSDKETEDLSSGESEAASQMTNLEENCGQAELSSTNVEESSLETEEQQTQISETVARHKTWSGKLKRPRSPGRFVPVSRKSKKCKSSHPILEGASKRRKAFVHGTDGKQSASKRTVELVLFGSTPPDKCVLLGSRNNHISPPEALSDARPPKVLTVSLSPLKRKTIKTKLTWDYSVKRLYKRWKISLPPGKIRRRKKKKAWKCTSVSPSEWSIKKADTIGPVDTKKLPVSSEMRILIGKNKPYLNLSWRTSLSEALTYDEEKRTIMLKQPADQERTNAENGSEAVRPLQNNDILKFSVLPGSFTFGSDGRKETKDPGQEKPDLVEGKDDDNHNKSAMATDTWYSNAEKKQCYPPTPYTHSLFHTFQKKYMEKMQPCVDE